MSYAKRVMRVTAYVLAVLCVLGFFAARSVYGSVGDAAIALGGELVRLGAVAGPSYRVSLNGESVRVSSVMTDDAIATVLDRFEKKCRDDAAGLAADFAQLSDGAKLAMPSDLRTGSAALGVMRREVGGRGVVACLAREDRGGVREVSKGLAEFFATGDLSKVGLLRYVVADRSAGSTRTHVVTAWAEGPLQILKMFPKEGDAPGSDAPNAARPNESKRLLTASVDGAPYSVRIYDVAGAPDAILTGYDAAMAPLGWQAIPGVQREMKNGRAFERSGVDLMIFAEQAAPGDVTRSIVSVVEMPPR